jgi:hypothetical protein|nr:MAG TPA: hypothetical protein [Caudoviricetes sp.]
MAKDSRIIRPFITDADDMYSFDDLDQMKSEIQSILGFDLKKIIRVNRFSNVDTKGRVHWRYLSDTQDNTSVEVRVNLSNDIVHPNKVKKYANVVVGIPFMNDTGTALQYWNGSAYETVPKKLQIGRQFAATGDNIEWTKIPVLLKTEDELKALDNIVSGDIFIIPNMPTATTAGSISMYFASVKESTEFPYNTEIDTATTGIHVYRISSLDFSYISNGTEDNTTGKLTIEDTAVVSGKALKYIQDNAVNKKSIVGVVSQASATTVHSSEVTKMIDDKATLALKNRRITYDTGRGTPKSYLYTERTLYKRKLEAGTNTFVFKIEDSAESITILADICSWTMNRDVSATSKYEFTFDTTKKELKLTYVKDASDTNTHIKVNLFHGYKEVE